MKLISNRLLVLVLSLWLMLGYAQADDSVTTFLPDAKAGETYSFDAKTLQESVNARLPTTIEYMYFFEITLNKAWLRIPEASERISMLLDTNVSIVMGSTRKTLLASVEMDSAIDYRAVESSVYLKEPNINDIVIAGMAPESSAQVNKVINSALIAYYERYPAYHLSAEEDEALDFAIDAIEVRDGRVRVRLGEKRVR
jgi:hypothetical protein